MSPTEVTFVEGLIGIILSPREFRQLAAEKLSINEGRDEDILQMEERHVGGRRNDVAGGLLREEDTRT